MTLRKKIILSNILAVLLPVAVIMIIWMGYIHMGSGAALKQIRRASEGGDSLTEAMNILYTFEAELSDMEWEAVSFPDGNGADVILSPDKERIREMESLGYHIQVASSSQVLFSNMDETDTKILNSIGAGRDEVSSDRDETSSDMGDEISSDMGETSFDSRESVAELNGQRQSDYSNSDGAILWSGQSLVIQDSFRLSGQNYYLTAVYNKNRVDRGVQNSLVPMYMISPTLLIVLIVAVLMCVALTSFFTMVWMNRSVLIPLEELEKGADQIADGDLDHRISYEGNDEFGDVCGAFDNMRMQLKEAKKERRRYDEQRRSLLRGISHDLRSPLTSIKGYAQGLKDGMADTEEKRIRYCNAILTRADDMERLTGSLSLLVKLENDRSVLLLQSVCLNEYICQLLAEKESWITEQRIETEYQNEIGDAEVMLDIIEMHRVFMNLFENTVKYRTKDHSKVRLSVHSNGPAAEIRFADDGPGVEEEYLGEIFEPFFRADEARTDPGSGSGIGLAVVKQIIEGENGQVHAISVPSGGLCIVMSLPLLQGDGTVSQSGSEAGKEQ